MAGEGTFRCQQLQTASLQPWLPLVSPLLREYVTNLVRFPETQASGLVAFGIDRVGPKPGEAQPIGLILAERVDGVVEADPSPTAVFILSVAIQRSFRRRGFARRLMTELQDWARGQGMALLRCPVPVPSPSSDALLKLTASELGWSATPGKVVVTLSISPAVEHLLVRLERAAAYQSRHATWTIASWPDQHTPALQQRVQMATEGQLAAPWDPDDDDTQWVPAVKYSRLLIANGEIVGWLITHFVSPDCLRYAKFWVDPGWEKSGAPLGLLADVMRSAHFCGGDDVIPKGCFISHPTNHLLHHWITKQFKPVCDRWLEIENRDLDLTRC